MTTVIDFLDLNVGLLKVGKPYRVEETQVYPIRYDGKRLIVKMPQARIPFGVNTRAFNVSFSLGKEYENNPVTKKLQELDDFFGEIAQEKLGLEWESLIEFSYTKDTDGNLVLKPDYPPHYNASLTKRSGKFICPIDVDGKVISVHEEIDIENELAPGTSVRTAMLLANLSTKGKKMVLRPKIHKVKVEDAIDVEFDSFSTAAPEFIEL
jgi:hypothetical protein